MKLPSFQFYPGDWRKDPNLARASLQAKGALIEILCLAFECEKRGCLKTGKKAWSVRDIAMAIGGNIEINEGAVLELLELKVLKKDKKGCIFSSKMVKDEELRKVRREAGSMGGNPNLVKQKVNQSANQNLTPSSSSSSSSSIKSLLSKKKVVELLRSAAHSKIPDTTIDYQADELIKKYSGKQVHNLQALCNEWASNIEVPVKRLIL